jgi:hypothetical protein
MKKSLKALIALTVFALFGLLLASPVVAEELKEVAAPESFSVFKNVNSADVKSIDDSQMNEILGARGVPTLLIFIGPTKGFTTTGCPSQVCGFKTLHPTTNGGLTTIVLSGTEEVLTTIANHNGVASGGTFTCVAGKIC